VRKDSEAAKNRKASRKDAKAQRAESKNSFVCFATSRLCVRLFRFSNHISTRSAGFAATACA